MGADLQLDCVDGGGQGGVDGVDSNRSQKRPRQRCSCQMLAETRKKRKQDDALDEDKRRSGRKQENGGEAQNPGDRPHQSRNSLHDRYVEGGRLAGFPITSRG